MTGGKTGGKRAGRSTQRQRPAGRRHLGHHLQVSVQNWEDSCERLCSPQLRLPRSFTGQSACNGHRSVNLGDFQRSGSHLGCIGPTEQIRLHKMLQCVETSVFCVGNLHQSLMHPFDFSLHTLGCIPTFTSKNFVEYFARFFSKFPSPSPLLLPELGLCCRSISSASVHLSHHSPKMLVARECAPASPLFFYQPGILSEKVAFLNSLQAL